MRRPRIHSQDKSVLVLYCLEDENQLKDPAAYGLKNWRTDKVKKVVLNVWKS